jgi:GTP-binding protein HflX
VLELEVPFARGDVLAAVHREGEVLDENHGEHGTRVTVRVDAAGAARFENWVVSA